MGYSQQNNPFECTYRLPSLFAFHNSFQTHHAKRIEKDLYSVVEADAVLAQVGLVL